MRIIGFLKYIRKLPPRRKTKQLKEFVRFFDTTAAFKLLYSLHRDSALDDVVLDINIVSAVGQENVSVLIPALEEAFKNLPYTIKEIEQLLQGIYFYQKGITYNAAKEYLNLLEKAEIYINNAQKQINPKENNNVDKFKVQTITRTFTVGFSNL